VEGVFEKMNTHEIKSFQQAVSTAAWALDLWSFANRLGSDADHAYTKDKFRELSELNRKLSAFDPETLSKIIN
jgi:hypothetical protein